MLSWAVRPSDRPSDRPSVRAESYIYKLPINRFLRPRMLIMFFEILGSFFRFPEIVSSCQTTRRNDGKTVFSWKLDLSLKLLPCGDLLLNSAFFEAHIVFFEIFGSFFRFPEIVSSCRTKRRNDGKTFFRGNWIFP